MRYIYKKRAYKLLFEVIDTLGWLVTLPFKAFGGKGNKEVGKILLIRCDHIGDVIASTSVLKPLRKAFPSATVDFMAPSWAAEALKNNPDISNLVVFDPLWFDRKEKRGSSLKAVFSMAALIKSGHYDAVIDLRGDARHIVAMFLSGAKARISYGITGLGFLLSAEVPYLESAHETERDMELVRCLGVRGRAGVPEVHFSAENSKLAENILKSSGVFGKYAIIHPVPGHKTKCWSEAGFAVVANYVKDVKKMTPVFVGSGNDSAIVRNIIEKVAVDSVDLSGKTDLGTLGAIIGRASLFVGVDSGPAHIAAASGVPTVIVFSGENDPAEWAPAGENVKVVFPGRGKDLSCVTHEEVIKTISETV